jgi:zinc protease
VPQGGKAAGAAPDNGALRRADRTSTSPAGGFALSNTKRVVLPNGLTLLLLENHRLPILVASAFVKGTRLTEPADQAGVASLVGNLLSEGTATRTGRQMATAIEDVGGDLSFSAAGGTVRVLAPDRALGLELLVDGLMRPSFPADALGRVRTQTLSALDDAEQQADYRAQRAFLEKVYGPDHPLGRPTLGRRSTVERLTADDCRRFHAARFVPNNTVVAVVGDFRADEVIAEVTRLTAGWKPAAPPAAELPASPRPTGFEQTILPVPESAQLYVYLGHLGVRRDHPDYYKLLVMDYVLGTGSGFTDRLSAALRDRLGLAYSVSASITANAGEAPGTFTGSIATFPDQFDAVKSGFLREIERIRGEAPSEQEVADAKGYLVGSLPFRFATAAAVAEQLLQIERFRLGFDYLEKFRAAVGEVTPADVRAAAAAHLDPNRLVLAAAGPVGADGKPAGPQGKK